MTTFTDDFERPDGGLGNNWTAGAGVVISSGHVTVPATVRMVHPDTTGTYRQEAICTFTVAAIGDCNGGPLLKATTTDGSGYSISCTGTLSVPGWRINRCATNGATTVLASVSGGAISAADHVIRFLYDNGTLTLWVDGYLIARTYDTTWASQTKAGWIAYTTNTALEDFALYGDESTSFTVTPSVVGNYAGTTEMSLVGVGTSWTPGTPGSPTFTVDHGSLSDQEVLTSTTATVVYDPGSFLGTATFTDPTTGATDTVTVTSDPESVPPGDLCPFDEDFVAMANQTLADAQNELVTIHTVIIPEFEELPANNVVDTLSDIWTAMFRTGIFAPGQENLATALTAIWYTLNGGYAMPDPPYPEVTSTTIKADVGYVITNMDEVRTANNWTLGSVITEICGTGVPQITDVLTAIENIPGGSNQDVLDALAGYFGASPPTIEQIGTMLSDLATIAGYNLGDVIDAINAIPAGSNQAVLDRLDDIQPNTAYTMSTITAQATNIAADVYSLGVEVAAVKAIVEDILAGIGGGPTAPVWPGESDVTLGTPVSLVDQLALEGPLDGVLVNVTTPPTRTGLRNVGGEPYDYSVGEIAFETDNGFIEPWQYLGFRQAIFVPRTMTSASRVLFRVLAGAAGTVTPWTRS